MGDRLREAQTLGVRSNLLVERSLSEIEDHQDRIILRTPNEPHYWAGNMVFFRGSTIDPDRQIAQFRKDFPEAEHRMFGWDTPDMKIGSAHEPFSELGYELEQLDVLSLTGPLNRAPRPDGIEIRSIQTEKDWQQVINLQIDTAVEQGYDRDSFGVFVRTRFDSRRRQIKEGLANWFGAFDGDLLVADLGIYTDTVVSRFQEVETRPSHRKRGICAALVTTGVDWAKAQFPTTVPVLLAFSDGPAGRIYRRCGFEHRETLVLAILPPQGTFERPTEVA